MKSRIKKIAMVIPKVGPVGGAERFAFEVAGHLSRNPEYEIHVFANMWQSDIHGVTFHKVPIITFPKFLTSISFAYFARRKINQMNFDLVHTHDRIFEADVFTMHGIPHRTWIKEIRGKKWMSLYDRATQWVEECILSSTRCVAFLPVSHLAQEKILKEFRVDPEKVQVIHPGVDIEKFQELSRSQCRREMRKHFGISPSDVVILFVSMNFEIKGLDYIINGIARAQSSHPATTITLLVAGKGNDKIFHRQAHNLGIGKNVIFAGVQKENLEKMYLASDLFMMLSRFDTFGIAVLEAMAASLPVIVSGNVGAKDVIREGENGFTIEDTQNTAMISEKIAVMLNEETRSEMAQEAYNASLDHSWQKVAGRISTVYEKILTSNIIKQ